MTKTEKLRRARQVRARLARFVDLQDKDVQAYVREKGTKSVSSQPDYIAMNHLLMAQKELSDMVRLLREEGFGQ